MINHNMNSSSNSIYENEINNDIFSKPPPLCKDSDDESIIRLNNKNIDHNQNTSKTNSNKSRKLKRKRQNKMESKRQTKKRKGRAKKGKGGQIHNEG